MKDVRHVCNETYGCITQARRAGTKTELAETRLLRHGDGGNHIPSFACHTSTILDCFVYQHQTEKSMSNTILASDQIGGRAHCSPQLQLGSRLF